MPPITQLGCETARKRSVVVGGLRLSFLEWGIVGRPTLCFLHGGSAHAHWFDLVTPAFTDRFHVISLDQRGHGESEWAKPPAYATANFTADLLGFIDALGLGRVALMIVDSRPTIPTDRLDRLRRRGERTLRPYPTREAAAQSFRLVPRETNADPALLAHMGTAGVVERDGAWV